MKLLIDGDVIAYLAAVASQHIIDDTEFGIIRPFAHKAEGEAKVDNIIFGLMKDLGAELYEVILSDPESNWRTSVDPSYKSNRADLQRPILLGHLKQYLRDNYGAYHWPSLEADDVLGVLATEPHDDKRVVVGRDKDFLSIPGFHHQWKKDIVNGRLEIREVTQAQADRFHLIQALAGDRVDGYGGCPGIGMARAAAIIDKPERLVPQPGVKTRGKNKGEAVTRWMAEPTGDRWVAIVSQYLKAGLTEKDALRNARVARILRHDEYDKQKERITLWTPALLRKAEAEVPFVSGPQERGVT